MSRTDFSANGATSFRPAVVLGDFRAWWVYLVGPVAGAVIAVGIGLHPARERWRLLRDEGSPGQARLDVGPGPIENEVSSTRDEAGVDADNLSPQRRKRRGRR